MKSTPSSAFSYGLTITIAIVTKIDQKYISARQALRNAPRNYLMHRAYGANENLDLA